MLEFYYERDAAFGAPGPQPGTPSLHTEEYTGARHRPTTDWTSEITMQRVLESLVSLL